MKKKIRLALILYPAALAAIFAVIYAVWIFVTLRPAIFSWSVDERGGFAFVWIIAFVFGGVLPVTFYISEVKE